MSSTKSIEEIQCRKHRRRNSDIADHIEAILSGGFKHEENTSIDMADKSSEGVGKADAMRKLSLDNVICEELKEDCD
ncbi:unnamed protein product [Moneuplotes crassus]|uniref:Uncharacterized protein n=1 Tax=Euplotes crassus TaxID=5936 RepID=A0AAD1XZJ1_EUPCR|nr:unnamed protein product [Moneuplotes crassus]